MFLIPFWAAAPIGDEVLQNGEIFRPYVRLSIRLSVRPSIRPSVPPLEGPRASQAGLRPSQSGLRASQAGLRASDAFERNIAKNRKTNPNLYFSYVNSSKKNRSKIGPLEQAKALNVFFASVFTIANDEPSIKARNFGNPVIEDVDVNATRFFFKAPRL